MKDSLLVFVARVRKRARKPSASIITTGLGVSRRADAWDEEDQAYLKDILITQSSVRRAYRIEPERDSQAG